MKRFLAGLLSVLMIVSMLPVSVFAADLANEFTLEVGSAEIAYGTATVTLDITVSNNPGFAGTTFELEFDDDVLSVNSVKAGDFAAFTLIPGQGSTSPYKIVFANFLGADVTGDGTLATVTFDVNADAEPGTYDVAINSNDEENGLLVTNAAGAMVDHTSVAGSVTIDEPDPATMFSLNVEDYEIDYGTETVEIPVTVKNNPGFAGATFELEFDNDAFAVNSVEAGDYAAFTLIPGQGTESPYKLVFANFLGEDVTGDGTLATIVLDVKETAELGEYEFAINSDDVDNGLLISNAAGKALKHIGASGIITILGEDFSTKVKLNDKTVTYNGEVQNLEFTGANYLPENYSVEYYCDGEVFEGAKNVGTYDVEAVLTAPGYNKKTFEATLTIKPKALTYSGAVGSREYDGTTDVNFTKNTVSGIVEGDDVTVDITAKMASANVSKSVAVNVSFEISGKDADNYTLPKTPSLSAAITARAITVTSNGTKKVGEKDPVLEPEIISGSLVEGDEFTGAITRAAGEEPGVYATKQGTLKLNSNYKLTFEEGEFEVIDRETQNFKAYITMGDDDDVDTVEYGSDEAIRVGLWCKASECVPDAIIKAVITSSNDDVVTLDESVPSIVLVKGAGEAVITVSVPGDDTYAPVEIKLPITVTKRAITITADDKTMKVGNEVPEFTYTLDGTVANGDALNVDLWFEGGEDIGEYEIHVEYELENADNYDVTVNNGTLSIIDKLPQSNIEITGEPIELTYGDEGFEFAVETTDGAALIGDVEVKSSNPEVLKVDGLKVSVLNAGNATIYITVEGNEDYASYEYEHDFTVHKRAITVQAFDCEKYVGQDDPELTYEIIDGSLVEGDEITGSLTRTSGNTAGKKYEIKIGTLTAGDNYELELYGRAYLTVLSKLDQQINIEMVTEAVYGDYGFSYDFDSYISENCNKEGEFTITSSNEDVAYVEGDTVYIKFAGKTNITVSVSGNYMYKDWSKTTVLTVAKRPLTITAKDASKRIDGDDPEFGYEIWGEAAYGDVLEVTVEREAGEDIGTYDIIPSYTLTNAESYDITVNNGTFTILDKYPQENISITGVPETVTYGDEGFELVVVTTDEADFLGEVTLTTDNADVLSVDGFNVTVNNAGKATLTLTAKGNEDYADYVYTKQITVNKREITVAADALTKYAGQDDPEFTYEITEGALVEGDEFTGSLTRTSGNTVGKKYEIKLGTLTLGTNYDITFVKNYLEVLKKLDQDITFTAPVAAQYGDTGLEWNVEKSEDSNIDGEIAVTSGNTDVAQVTEDGTVVITGVGKAALTATVPGNYMYNDWESKINLTVSKRSIVITADDVTKKIENDDPELTYTLDGSTVNDDVLAVTLTREEGEALGTYDIDVEYTLDNASCYNVTVKNGTFTIIDKYPQTITAPAEIELTYGDEAYTLEAASDLDDAVVEYALDSDNVVTLTEDNKLRVVGVGEAVLTVTSAGNDDYADAEKRIKVTVLPKEIKVSIEASSNEIYYGEELQYSLVYSGVVSGETTAMFESKAAVELETEAGTYTVYASGAKADNYTFTYLPFEYTIKPCELNISSISFYNREYEEGMDSTVQFIRYSLGVVNGVPEFFFDDFDVEFEAEIKTEITGAGTYPVKFTVTVTGNDAGNYVMENDGRYGFEEDIFTVEVVENYGAQELAEQLTEHLLESVMTGNVDSVIFPELPEGFEISVKEDVLDQEGNTVINAQGKRVSDSTGTFDIAYVITNTNEDDDTAEISGTIRVPELEKLNVTVIAENGTVEGEGEYTVLDEITLKATANKGYAFSRWEVDGKKVSTDKTYTFKLLDHMLLGEDLELTAVFKKNGGGGGGGGGATTYYYVTFNTDDETSEKVKVEGGDKVAKPEDPEKEGFNFEGWFTDASLTKLYDFNKAVTESFDLYAKWVAVETDDGKTDDGEQGETEKWTNPFTDVKEDDWFYTSVEYASNKGLFKGMTETTFGPSELLTRAMLVTVLYRAEGEPEIAVGSDFADVSEDAYYAKAVAWAKANGVVNGVTVTEFAPDANITREQIATIIFRYAAYKGMNAVTLEENLHFDDADTISEYAVSALNWAVGTGLMKGRTETTLNPRDNATRAEAATILMRYFTEIAQ